jgi:protein involved in sex pheromone biosynthesis
MPNYAEYFARTGYQATYQIGDRVRGYWNKIPFTGTVGNDRLVNHTDGPEVTVHLDLPIHYQGKILSIIIAKHKILRLLK